MTRPRADVPAVLTGRMFWDHVWHESKTSPCAVQESPSVLSTVSHTRCRRGAEGRASCLASPAWWGGSSLWAWMSQRGVQHPWGCYLPPTPAPRGCSPGTVLHQIRHCISAVLAMSQAERRQCLAGKGFPGFMGGPGCSQPPALLGRQTTGLLCHHLSCGIAGSWLLVPSVLPFTGMFMVSLQSPRLLSVYGCSQRRERGSFHVSTSASIFRNMVDASINRSLGESGRC